MVKKFKTYFESLEALSTKALDRAAVQLVRAEKRNVALLKRRLGGAAAPGCERL